MRITFELGKNYEFHLQLRQWQMKLSLFMFNAGAPGHQPNPPTRLTLLYDKTYLRHADSILLTLTFMWHSSFGRTPRLILIERPALLTVQTNCIVLALTSAVNLASLKVVKLA